MIYSIIVCADYIMQISLWIFHRLFFYLWKELVVATNRNMLKLFTIISIKCSCYDYEQITLQYLCTCMGIEPTDGNQKYISTMVNALRKLGMIDIQQEADVIYSEEAGKKLVKRHNYYRLTTKEEYDLINRIK